MARIKAGRVFGGDYVIERELAKGGFGAVFLVTQRSTGQRRALKVMLPQLVDGEKARERFAREAKIGAEIRSRHLVQVLAAGVDVTDDEETPWLVMELLDGETLAQRLDRVGRLAPADTLRVIVEAGHALADAHLREPPIIHCDLKPENLFLARSSSAYGDTEEVKVLDFGIARIAAEKRASATVTAAVGSVLWMAPEQAARGFRVSPRTDVWSLGLIAFRCLTGKCYWVEADVGPGEEIASAGVLVELTAMPLATASERASALGVGGTLPPGFDAWFARCVNRDVAQRFPHAGAAVEALRGVLGGAVTSVPPTAPLSDPPRVPGVGPHGTAPVGVGWAPPAPAPVHVPPAQASAPRKRSARPMAVGGAVALFAAVAVGLRFMGGDGGTRAAGVPDAGRVVPQPPPPPRPTCPDGMVEIPAGRFTMGSPEGTGESDEHPAHVVEVPRAFCIDRTEVTVAAYRVCREAGGCASDPTTHNPGRSTSLQRNFDYFCNWGRAGTDQHPVNCVDWNQARAFCAWSGLRGGARRLPTEAEWEYAARGPAGRIYAWGNALEAGRANFCGTECVAAVRSIGLSVSAFSNWTDSADFTAPVGSFPSGNTPEGVADLAGNVWEWVEDTYSAMAYATRGEGFNARVAVTHTDWANSDNRVIRGGGWNGDGPSGVRASDRDGGTRTSRVSGVGFRCARDL